MGAIRHGLERDGLAGVLAQALARPELAADAALEVALAELVAAGVEAWPTVSLDAEAFVRHLARAVPAGAEPRSCLPSLHARDLYLACACAQGDPAAIAVLDRRFIAPATRYLRPSERATLGDEVRQELRDKLLVGSPTRAAGIGRYSGTGPLEGWLRITTVRCARSLGREERRPAKRRAELDSQALLRVPNPEADFLRVHYRPQFEDALQRAMNALAPRERNLLRLHYLDGIPLDRLGLLHHVSRATATRWVAAARQALLDETFRLLHEQVHFTRAEFDSLLRYVKSSLAITIQRSIASLG